MKFVCEKCDKGFASKYNIRKLAYFEEYNHPRDAIIREKQLKGWLRHKKINLITLLILIGMICANVFDRL